MRSTPALGTRWALPEIQPGSLAQAPARGAPFGSLGSGRDRQPAPGHPGGPGRAAGGVSRPSATSRRLGDDPGAQSPPHPRPGFVSCGAGDDCASEAGLARWPPGGTTTARCWRGNLGAQKNTLKIPKKCPHLHLPLPLLLTLKKLQ